jgi:hypothetical protein
LCSFDFWLKMLWSGIVVVKLSSSSSKQSVIKIKKLNNQIEMIFTMFMLWCVSKIVRSCRFFQSQLLSKWLKVVLLWSKTQNNVFVFGIMLSRYPFVPLFGLGRHSIRISNTSFLHPIRNVQLHPVWNYLRVKLTIVFFVV